MQPSVARGSKSAQLTLLSLSECPPDINSDASQCGSLLADIIELAALSSARGTLFSDVALVTV